MAEKRWTNWGIAIVVLIIAILILSLMGQTYSDLKTEVRGCVFYNNSGIALNVHLNESLYDEIRNATGVCFHQQGGVSQH